MRIGVVGYGYFGPNVARAFEAEWVCDTSEERLKIVPAHIKTTADYGEMLKNVDAVAVCTPLESHFGLAMQAIEAGKHVFVEKPMTHSVESASHLVKAAEAKGVMLAVDHTFIFTGAVKKLLQTDLGNLLYYQSTRVNLGIYRPDADVIWDLASHDFAILCALTNKIPTHISAIGSAHVGSKYDTANITVTYDCGLAAYIFVSWLSPIKVRTVILAGAEKMAVYDDCQAHEKLKIYDSRVEVKQTMLAEYRTGDVVIPKLSGAEALAQEAAAFRYGYGYISGVQGLRVVRMLEAATKSAVCGGARQVVC